MQHYDAVVVATGRYNAPNIPEIDGVAEWAKQFPERISHSRQYRRPEPYVDETVLIVGGAVSATQRCRRLFWMLMLTSLHIDERGGDFSRYQPFCKEGVPICSGTCVPYVLRSQSLIARFLGRQV